MTRLQSSNFAVTTLAEQILASAVSPLSFAVDNWVVEQGGTNIVANGNFANGTTGWTPIGASNTVAINILSNTGNGANSSAYVLSAAFLPTIGDKLYVSSKQKVINAVSTKLRLYLYDGTVSLVVKEINLPAINNQYLMSGIITVLRNTNHNIYMSHIYVDAATALNKVMEVQEVMAIDLTGNFGAGNEPTAAWCDANFPLWFDGYLSRMSMSQRMR